MKPTVLIIMPVGSDPEHDRRRAAIERGVTHAGFEAQFPSYELESPQFDMRVFADQLRQATVVLADLSGERPSCYFELGFAQALGCNTLMLAEGGTPIHQSAARETLTYYSDYEQLEHAVLQLLLQRR